VCDVAAKVSPDDAVPSCTVLLVQFSLHELCYSGLLGQLQFTQRMRGAIDAVLLDVWTSTRHLDHRLRSRHR